LLPESEAGADATAPLPADAPGRTSDAGQTDAAPTAHRAARLFWWVTLVVIVLDQITKEVVVRLLPLYESQTLIPGLVDFVHVRNAGVAFGLLNDVEHPQRALMTSVLALVALAGIAFYARHIRHEERLARVGLSLILGGALGNLIDRLRQAYVVDFVDVYFRGWHFWAFNVADAAITIGAIFVFLDLLLGSRHASNPV